MYPAFYFLLSAYYVPNREGNGNLLQYACLENPMDGRTWWATVHGVAKSLIRLSRFTFTFNPQLRRLSALVFARLFS